jgi:LGFP repeat
MKRYTLAIGIVSGLAGILTFANPAAALTPRGCSGALAVGSAPAFKITGTGIGVKLRGEPLTNTSNWEKGPSDGATFRLLAQTSGDPTGNRANTVWNFVQLADGRQGYIADTWATTPGVANQYYNPVPRCGAATAPATPATQPQPVSAFTVNGTVMGVVTSPAHSWGACEVIDYNVGLSGSPWGWFLRSRIPGGTYYVIRTGFWSWYRANDGINRLGCPTGDEYAYGNGARQNFQKGILQWNSTGTTFIPNPAPARQTVSARAADIAQSYAVGGTQWGGNACKAAGRSGLLGTSPGGYRNSTGGDGQCRSFVNCIIYLASNKAIWPTDGSYAWAGGRVVPAADAIRGDVVQVGIAGHTVIVLKNLGATPDGGRKLWVVDSNSRGNGTSDTDEIVREHEYTAPASAVFARYEQPV